MTTGISEYISADDSIIRKASDGTVIVLADSAWIGAAWSHPQVMLKDKIRVYLRNNANVKDPQRVLNGMLRGFLAGYLDMIVAVKDNKIISIAVLEYRYNAGGAGELEVAYSYGAARLSRVGLMEAFRMLVARCAAKNCVSIVAETESYKVALLARALGSECTEKLTWRL